LLVARHPLKFGLLYFLIEESVALGSCSAEKVIDLAEEARKALPGLLLAHSAPMEGDTHGVS